MRRLACDSIDCPVYTARARNGDELHAVSEALATLGLTSLTLELLAGTAAPTPR